MNDNEGFNGERRLDFRDLPVERQTAIIIVLSVVGLMYLVSIL